MRGRKSLVLGLLGLAALAAGVAPWTVDFDPVKAAVSRQIQTVYGLDLTVAGRSVVALLPVPRLKLEDVALSAPGGQVLVKAGQLRAEFRILPLLLGRFDLSEVSLSDAGISVEIAESGDVAWGGSLSRLQDRLTRRTSGGHLERIVLSDARLTYRDLRTRAEAVVDDVNATLDWPTVDGTLTLRGSGLWAGETVTVALTNLKPTLLASGAPSRFDLQAGVSTGQLVVGGEAVLGPGPRANGRLAFQSRSLRDLLGWSGFKVPFGPAITAVTLDGDFSAQGRTLFLPSVRMTLGPDRLDGAVTARMEESRLSVAGTLATDWLDLTNALGVLAQARTADGSWSSEPVDLGSVDEGELDLRLSASNARVGAVTVSDLAANVIVKPGRIEASLGRASLNRGVVKGRLALASAPAGVDVKLHGSFDRIDVGALSADIGAQRWISGVAQGQMSLEAAGATASELAAHAQGRMSAVVRQGELVGIALGESLRRLERRPLSASDWRGGRTPFDQLQMSLAVSGGMGEIVDGQLSASALRTILQGRISLADRMVWIKAAVEGAGGSSLLFDVNGPWNDVAVTPDVRPLIQRSGAAQPLLPSGQRTEGDGTSGTAVQ